LEVAKIIGKKIIANILLILDKYEFIEDEDLSEKNKSDVDKKTCTRKLLLTNMILTSDMNLKQRKRRINFVLLNIKNKSVLLGQIQIRLCDL